MKIYETAYPRAQSRQAQKFESQCVSNPCKFDEFEVLPLQRKVLKNGAPVALGARAFDLLSCLIAGRDRVVSKNDLIDAVWPGLVVTENNLNVQILALRRQFGPQVALTVAGKGFRFGFAMTDGVTDKRAALRSPLERRTKQTRRTTPAGAAQPRLDSQANSAAALELPLPSKPSIVVLPFLQLGDAGALGYFADAISEDITTELSRFHSLFVISRNSAFTYKGQAIDVRQIGRDLGVHYALEGSVRHTGTRIRVTAQLIDAQTGNHIWAEKYDRSTELAFEVLEELPNSIVSAMAPQVVAAEGSKARRARPSDLNAHGLALRSAAIQHVQGMSGDRQAFDEALRLAREALQMDPQSGAGWRVLAGAQWLLIYFNFSANPASALNEALDACARAISLDSTDHFSHTLKGLLSFMAKQPDVGLQELRCAHEINPNDAYSLAWLAFYEATLGHAEVAVAYGQNALRLSPRDPMRHGFLLLMAGVYFSGGDYAQGLHFAQRSKLEAPNAAGAEVALAINWVGLGHLESAKAAFDEAQRLAPQLVAARLSGVWPSPGTSYRERAHRFFQLASGRVAADE